MDGCLQHLGGLRTHRVRPRRLRLRAQDEQEDERTDQSVCVGGLGLLAQVRLQAAHSPKPKMPFKQVTKLSDQTPLSKSAKVLIRLGLCDDENYHRQPQLHPKSQ